MTHGAIQANRLALHARCMLVNICGGLGDGARNHYFFARTAVGRDYGPPIVLALENGPTH